MGQKENNIKARMTIALILFIVILIASILGLFGYYDTIKVNYTPTEYEDDLIEYFKEIALETEYFDNPQKVVKWKGKMVLFILKDQENERLMKVIRKTIQKINELSTDGFKIE